MFWYQTFLRVFVFSIFYCGFSVVIDNKSLNIDESQKSHDVS